MGEDARGGRTLPIWHGPWDIHEGLGIHWEGCGCRPRGEREIRDEVEVTQGLVKARSEDGAALNGVKVGAQGRGWEGLRVGGATLRRNAPREWHRGVNVEELVLGL